MSGRTPRQSPEDLRANTQRILAEIRANKAKLDTCACHRFVLPVMTPYKLGLKLDCVVCGGSMDAVTAYAYGQGYQAAGKPIEHIFPNWHSDDAKEGRR